MDTYDKIKALKTWQNHYDTETIRCNNENHPPLEPVIKNKEVVLFCYTCNHIIEDIPENVFQYGHLLSLSEKKRRKEFINGINKDKKIS